MGIILNVALQFNFVCFQCTVSSSETVVSIVIIYLELKRLVELIQYACQMHTLSWLSTVLGLDMGIQDF